MFYSNKLFHIFPSFFLSSKSILLLVSCNSACHALLFKGSLYLILEKLKFEFWDYTLRCISTLYFWRLYLKISFKKMVKQTWFEEPESADFCISSQPSVSVLSPLWFCTWWKWLLCAFLRIQYSIAQYKETHVATCLPICSSCLQIWFIFLEGDLIPLLSKHYKILSSVAA